MTLSVSLDAAGLSQGLEAAGAEISRLAQEEIAPAAALIEEAFAGAARGIEQELSRAARTGEVSLRRLGRAIVADLASGAVNGLLRKPLERAFAAPFGGGRAEGGFTAHGQSFLVGERGAEIFTPAASGRVSPMAAAPVNVTIALPGVTDAESFRASETQIAAGLARVLSRGARNQ
ncbi:MAG: phage tail tape measure C-terminal domain-containing protein [Parvularculaceae bacterium]